MKAKNQKKLVWLTPALPNNASPDLPKAVYKYKKVSQKVHPVRINIPEHQKPQRHFPEDPLKNLPTLPYLPPNFSPTTKITTKRMDQLDIDNHQELWPQERKLLQLVIKLNERSIAFDETERGTFRSDYFSDYVIPTIKHIPWIEGRFHIPEGQQEELIKALKDKIRAGVYERAYTVYRSRWFAVGKKNGGLRIVHDLQSLNKVTIRDSALPPIIEEFVEAYAGRSVYTVLDMYWGFHARTLDINSRDYTAFQTPLGVYRLTSLPMGYANAPAEFQACMQFLLHDEIPHVAGVFIDDIPIKGPATRYLNKEGKEETIPENPGIRKYIWEHINDVHRILHRLGEAGGTVSAEKMQLCKEEVEIVGHKCSSRGREPIPNRTKKIHNWPTPLNLKEVRGFLGLCGTVRNWIKNYSIIAKPLVDLTRKNIRFHWKSAQEEAFTRLKELVSSAPALRPIDYKSDNPVIFSVDTSIFGIGFILSQEDENGENRVPARYGSLPITDVQSNYSQSKLELFGLFRALHAYRGYLQTAKKLTVEVDASCIKGMLKNPDTQATALINRWIQAILLFDFKLKHVSASKHQGPDALSRRRYTSADEDDIDPSEAEDWVERIALVAGIVDDILSDHTPSSPHPQKPSRNFLKLPTFPQYNDDMFSDTEFKTAYPAAVKPQYTEQDMTDILTYLVTGKMPALKTVREQKQFQKKAEPFYLEEAHMYRQRPGQSTQVVVFLQKRRQEILWEMHEDTAHHGTWAVDKQITLRYFWPGMKNQIKSHIRSCHDCQIRSTKKMHIPVTISHPPSLFSKVYLDVMNMPKARGKRWLIGCRDDLSGITECKAIARDRIKIIVRFFLKRIILRYGIVQEVVTDNGPSFGQEFTDLLAMYGIRHIKISAYNSQSNGVVERGHYNIREALIKLCNGDLDKWPLMVPAAVYADRITIRRATGFSPYYLLHGVHPLMPGDLTDATFLVTDFRPGMSRAELIEARTRQLLRLPEDIEKARLILKKSRFRSKQAYEDKFSRRLIQKAYEPEDLVLIRNNPIENSVSIERKTADRYMGPYQVIR